VVQCGTIEECIEWIHGDGQDNKKEREVRVVKALAPPPPTLLENQLSDLGFDKDSIAQAVIRSSTLEGCLSWLINEGDADGADRHGHGGKSDHHLRAASTSSGTIDQTMILAQRKANIITDLVGMGYGLEESVEVVKSCDNLEICLETHIQREEARGAHGGGCQEKEKQGNRGGLFIMEDNLLALGLDEVVRYDLEDSRHIDSYDPLAIHYRICTSQLCCDPQATTYLKRGVTLRIQYILNPKLIRRFRMKEEEMKA